MNKAASIRCKANLQNDTVNVLGKAYNIKNVHFIYVVVEICLSTYESRNGCQKDGLSDFSGMST